MILNCYECIDALRRLGEEIVDGSAKKSLVSIIVPVYNVEDYVEQCLESIVSQSYAKIEIIVVDDGSLDSSGKLCKNFAKSDCRIKYFHKENGGLSSARNYGIDKASGEYICFVDSDDFIHKDYVMKMYQIAYEENADIVECDYEKIFTRNDETEYFNVTSCMGVQYSREELIRYGSVIICVTLSKRSIWKDYNIRFPNVKWEDLSIFMYLISKCNKISLVNEALYYYRKDREGNISTAADSFFDVSYAIENLINLFKFDGSIECNCNILKSHVLRWFSRKLSPCIYLMNDKDYQQIIDRLLRILDDNFANWNKKKSFVLGSYSLSKIIINMPMLENPKNRYSFSSLISIMANGKVNTSQVTHRNPYRKFMLNRDFNKSFLEDIKKFQPEYLFIDFLEERFDIIKYADTFITKSDAFDESNVQLLNTKVIDRTNCGYMELWENSCDRFVDLFETQLEDIKIVLVENYLSTYKSNGVVRDYEDVKYIQKMNGLLKKQYEYFVMKSSNCIFIKSFELQSYVTDEKFEYGCRPEHYNDRLYYEIAKKTMESLNECED